MCKFRTIPAALRWVIVAGSVVVGATWTSPALGQVKGVSYSLTPVIEGVFFEDDAALKDAVLFGGRVGFGFGELIELDGVFLFSNNLTTDLGGLSGFDEITQEALRALPARDLGFQRFGGNVKFNIGSGVVFPFVTLGGGVVRFIPTDLNSSKSIYLSAGLGVQFSYRNRYTILVQAKNLSYRYNPASTLMSEDDLAAAGLGPDDFQMLDVNNFSANVGVQIYLGGRAMGEMTELDRALQEQLRGGLRGIALRVEPSAAEVDFPESLGYRDDQRFVGLGLGFDLGPLVGLRAFYWRGTKSDTWSEFDDIQAFGGEMKLVLSEAGGSIVPYVNVGGGRMDVLDGYSGNGMVEADDQAFVFGGVGVLVPVGDAVGVELGVRSVLMTREGIDNVSEPNDVEASTMVYGGVSFGIGRRARGAGPVFGREMEEARSERERLSSDLSAQDAELERTAARLDSLSTAIAIRQQALEDSLGAQRYAPGRAPVASSEILEDSAAAPGPMGGGDTPAGSAVRTRQWVSLPVPEVGELYVRYGESGGLGAETVGGGAPVAYLLDPVTGELTPVGLGSAGGVGTGAGGASGASAGLRTQAAPGAAVETGTAGGATSVQPTSPEAGDAPLTESEIREIVRSALAEERGAAPGAEPATPAVPGAMKEPVAVERSGDAPEVQVTAAGAAAGATEPPQSNGRQFSARPLVGYNFNQPKQGLVGVRGEFQRVGRLYRLSSDLILGFGDDKTTFNINLNGVYALKVGLGERLYPYGGLGFGFINLDDFEAVLNLIVGSDIRVGDSVFFLEFMNQDLDNNRLLAGYLMEF